MIDNILREHRSFARAYVDDIVSFSMTLDEHLQHLERVLSTLRERNIKLSAKKTFLGYPSIKLLGQRMDALGLATAEEKLKAILQLKFPKNLKALETYLGMTGYLRQYIPYYAQIVKPLQMRKTLLNQTIGVVGKMA